MAILLVVLVGVTALVVDLGFQFGQKRYDQNGADAAALAAARKLAASADVRSGAEDVYFLVNDSRVYDEVLEYVISNQNSKVAEADDLVVTLEYAPTPGAWCLSPAVVARYPTIAFPGPVCTLQTVTTATGLVFTVPPFPSADDPYRVRVNVSSTVDPVFFQAFKSLIAGPGASPGGAPAGCYRAPGAGPDDLTTCARAVAAVRSTTEFAGMGPLLPVTRGNCDLNSTTEGMIHALMGPHNAADCGFDNLNPWKNVLDFSPAEFWDDGEDYDYKFANLLPTPGNDKGWNRDGDNGRYKPDTTVWPATGEMRHDFLGWVAFGFHGTIVPDNPDHNDGSANDRDGVKLPTYVTTHPDVGNQLGNLIADGFYCSGKGEKLGCDTDINPSGQYYFSQAFSENRDPTDPFYGASTQLPCDDTYGEIYAEAPKRLGCRDATIAVWENTLEWAVKHGKNYTGWTEGIENAPDRIMPVRFVTMRIYCQEGNTPGVCDEPPKVIVGNADTSGVYGRYAPDVLSVCPPGKKCDKGPRVTGVVVTLEE